MRINSLSLEQYRNIARCEIRPGEGVNLIVGDNGMGKTSTVSYTHLDVYKRQNSFWLLCPGWSAVRQQKKQTLTNNKTGPQSDRLRSYNILVRQSFSALEMCIRDSLLIQSAV